MRSSDILSSALGFAALATASPFVQASKRDACSGNTADDRSTWCDYSLSTNFYDEVPDTGVTREYWFNVEQGTAALDGYERVVQTFNGSIPGPTIEADWGDTVVVHVANNFALDSNNGTSIHFHGIRQNFTNEMDGVVAITQCPLAPGDSQTYTWRATQYGTTWYHSHLALQAWDGLFGGILINGPASSNYDVDKGVLFLNDWTHQTADELWYSAETTGPPVQQNGLINGTNVYGDDGASNQTGTRFSTQFESGSSYRLRLINGAIDTLYKFSIDNHTLTVISSDLVPIEPFNTDVLSIAIGQRYDVVVTANQASVADNFWMRAVPATGCSSTNEMQDNIRGIVYYGNSAGTPETDPWTGYDATDCFDEDASNLVPYLSLDAESPYVTNEEEVSLGTDSSGVLFRWFINDSSFQVEWGNPTILEVLNNATNYTSTSNILEVDETDEWVYLVIENSTPIPHPIHLHGHDFYLLAQGNGTESYSSSTALNLSNPPRRDVAMMQASPGYLVLAFRTDNPGAWLVHCHIGWHVAGGLALQYLERKSEIPTYTNSTAVESQCSDWNAYATQYMVVDDDSGV